MTPHLNRFFDGVVVPYIGRRESLTFDRDDIHSTAIIIMYKSLFTGQQRRQERTFS